MSSSKSFQPFLTPIIWPMLYAAVFIHSGFIYGMYLMLTFRLKFYSYLWCKLLFMVPQNLLIFSSQILVAFLVCSSIIGVTAGSHRLFSHRSYKVKTPMKYLVLLLISISGQVRIKLFHKTI